MAAGQLLVLLAAVVAQVAGQCGKPPTLENGAPTDQLNETFPVGTKIHYTCHPGYMLQEFSIPWVVCQDNSTWSLLWAKCNPKSCGSPGEILNGHYNATDNTFGSTVKFYCNEGYTLVGHDTRLCDVDGWTGQVPKCEVVRCPDLPPIANGTVSGLDREFWEYGMIASYSCAPGLLLVGAAKITCEASGKWSASPPTCKGQCDKPPTLENGAPTYQLNETFPVGTKIHYTCHPGYVFLEFSIPWVVCRDNSTWSPLWAKCNPKSCGSPGEILNGHYIATGNTFGSTVKFYCNEGYTLVGHDTRLCDVDGWTGQVPKCEVVRCPDLPPIANGTVSGLDREFWEYGMIASYSCAPGLLLVGAAKITCEASGKWSASPPTCKGQCDKPPTLENGVPADQLNETFPVGTKIHYTCHPGYVFQESSIPWVVCQDNSTWSPLWAKCNPKSCGSPGEILNGHYIATGNTFGSTVKFYCNEGYTLVGHDTRLCDVDGWTGQVPKCEVVRCPDLPPIANGTVSGLDREFWEYGMTASYSCAPGLLLVGAAKITCEASGKWSASPPTCKAASSSTASTSTVSNNTTVTHRATTATSGSAGTSVGYQYILFLILTVTIYPVFNHD